VWESDLLFAEDGGRRYLMDVVMPNPPEGRYPAILFIPLPRETARSTYTMQMFQAAKRGYVAATLDLSPTDIAQDGNPKFPLPAQLLDVKRALTWLRGHAEKFHVDPDAIGVIGWGFSGYVALMAGLTGPEDGFEPAGAADDDVQAVVTLAGVSDWTRMPIRDATWVLGCTVEDLPRAAAAMSPLAFADRGDPPVLIVQGRNDAAVVPGQAVAAEEGLRSAGVSCRLEILEGVDHMRAAALADSALVWEFFDGYLKRR
jgi:acetyl esterase/lipase